MRVVRPLAACLVLLAAVPALPAAAAQGPYDTGGAVLNILPPGSRGNVGVADALAVGPSRTATPDNPENFFFNV